MVPSLVFGFQSKYPVYNDGDISYLDMEVPSDSEVYEYAFGSELYNMSLWVNDNLESKDVLLTMCSERYLFVPQIMPVDYFGLRDIYNLENNITKIITVLKELGVTHILDIHKETTMFSDEGSIHINIVEKYWEKTILYDNLDDSSLFQLLNEDGNIRIYSIS